MNERTLHRTTFVARPRAEVFAFFADPANLERLTPPWLSFRIVTPRPIAMREGLRIDYRISLHGLPLRWQSEITAWEPPSRFVDEQRRGPYRLWIHEHRFLEREGGTEIVDLVRYAVPGGRLVEKLFVDRELARIFDYRRDRIAALLASDGTKPAADRGRGSRAVLGDQPPPVTPSQSTKVEVSKSSRKIQREKSRATAKS